MNFSTYCTICHWKTNIINIIYKTFQPDCDATCNFLLHTSVFKALKKCNNILNGYMS